MKNDWAWIILAAFTFSFALQLWLEHAHKVDSLGLWYTALSAGLYTAPAAILAWIAAWCEGGNRRFVYKPLLTRLGAFAFTQMPPKMPPRHVARSTTACRLTLLCPAGTELLLAR